MTAEERDALVGSGILKTVDAATRDRWVAAVTGLASLRDRVRDLSRQALATPGPDAPPELRQMIAQLEELTRQKSALDALVWNGPTQEYLQVTFPGHAVLEDLKVWQGRLAGRDLDQFRQELDAYRVELVSTVERAGVVYRDLVLDEQTREEDVMSAQPFTTVDLRFASMILAKRPVNAGMLASAFQWFNHETNWGDWSKEDRLVASAILASLAQDPMWSRNNFERLRIQLSAHGIMPEDRVIVAASLADLPEGWWDQVFSRVDDLRGQRPTLNALLVGALARSPYSVPEALGRFDAALAGIGAKGYKDGIQMDVAAAILAAAQIPEGTMVDRFAYATPQVAGAFDPPFAPAAMLASSPLEPPEAIEVFRDCIGTVTRMNFFDITLEIEELALIMSYGVAPLGAGYLGGNLPPGPLPSAAVPAAAVVPAVYGIGPAWFVWHNYFVYRPIGRYIATHPVHIHTVAAFG